MYSVFLIYNIKIKNSSFCILETVGNCKKKKKAEGSKSEVKISNVKNGLSNFLSLIFTFIANFIYLLKSRWSRSDLEHDKVEGLYSKHKTLSPKHKVIVGIGK